MRWVAISMLYGDRAKFVALVFGIAFATFLMAQQSAFCIGLISLAGNLVRSVDEASIWVMRAGTQSAELALPLPSEALLRVRGVPGVRWAVPYLRGGATVRTAAGSTETVNLVGVDDATLVGVPHPIVDGRLEDLRRPDGVILNLEGFDKLFPGQTPHLGATIELNDHRALVVGFVKSIPTFGSSNTVFARYSNAVNYAPTGRNNLSFILVRGQVDLEPREVARRIQMQTGLKAVTRNEFIRQNIDYTVKSTAIVPGFAIVVVLGIIVGAAIVFLTLSLFIRDNLKQFGALRAIGVANKTIVAMVLTQAALVGVSGFGVGIGATAWVIAEIARNSTDLSTFYLPWQVIAGSSAVVATFVTGAALISIRRLLLIDPATAFR